MEIRASYPSSSREIVKNELVADEIAKRQAADALSISSPKIDLKSKRNKIGGFSGLAAWRLGRSQPVGDRAVGCDAVRDGKSEDEFRQV
jgi:hypothetical protein